MNTHRAEPKDSTDAPNLPVEEDYETAYPEIVEVPASHGEFASSGELEAVATTTNSGSHAFSDTENALVDEEPVPGPHGITLPMNLTTMGALLHARGLSRAKDNSYWTAYRRLTEVGSYATICILVAISLLVYNFLSQRLLMSTQDYLITLVLVAVTFIGVITARIGNLRWLAHHFLNRDVSQGTVSTWISRIIAFSTILFIVAALIKLVLAHTFVSTFADPLQYPTNMPFSTVLTELPSVIAFFGLSFLTYDVFNTVWNRRIFRKIKNNESLSSLFLRRIVQVTPK